MWTAYNAPSDRDYAEQFAPYPDDEEEEIEEEQFAPYPDDEEEEIEEAPEEILLECAPPVHCARCGSTRETVEEDVLFLNVRNPVCCEAESIIFSQEAA